MIFYVDGNKKTTLNPSIEELDKWWRQETAEIYSGDRLIHFVEVDGQKLYSSYEQFIVNNINTIEKIDINTISLLESIDDTEISLNNYLINFIPAVNEISDCFYGDVNEEVWQKFSEVIQGLEWIMQALQFERTLYLRMGSSAPDYLSVIEPLEKALGELEQSMHNQDYVSVGDILQYELAQNLERFQLRTAKREQT